MYNYSMSFVCVPLENISLIDTETSWRRHHCRRRAAKFRPMFGPPGFWDGRDHYRATSAVTRDLAFCGLIRRAGLYILIIKTLQTEKTDSIAMRLTYLLTDENQYIYMYSHCIYSSFYTESIPSELKYVQIHWLLFIFTKSFLKRKVHIPLIKSYSIFLNWRLNMINIFLQGDIIANHTICKNTIFLLSKVLNSYPAAISIKFDTKHHFKLIRKGYTILQEANIHS